MQINYSLGLSLSIIFGAVTGISVVIFSRATDGRKFEFLMSIPYAFYFVVITLGVATVVYPILNMFLLRDKINIGFIQAEFSSGVLALRVSSITTGILILREWKDIILETLHAKNTIRERYEVRAEFSSLTEVHDGAETFFIIMAQHAIYLLTILVLWTFSVFKIRTLLVSLMNWGLFFIIDDWRIISDYMIQLKGRILKSHDLRINIFNILLSILLIYSAFLSLQPILAFVITFMLLTIMFVRYIDKIRYIIESRSKSKL